MTWFKKDACAAVENKTKLVCIFVKVILLSGLLTTSLILLEPKFTKGSNNNNKNNTLVKKDMPSSMKTFWYVNGSGGGSHKDRIGLRIDDKSIYIQIKAFKNTTSGIGSQDLKRAPILMTVLEFEALNRILSTGGSSTTNVELLNGNRRVTMNIDHTNDDASVTLFKKNPSNSTNSSSGWIQKSIIDVTMDTLRRLLDHYPLIIGYINKNASGSTFETV